jgi:CRISPR type IV-associated protein Csf2
MQTRVFEGVVTALTSISHIGDTHGVNAKLRREKFVQANGRVEEVPVISGNSIRGILRDRGMLHMLKVLGYGVNEETDEVAGLSLPAFYFLFSGGSLTSNAGRGIDIDEARRWRSLIPLVAVFGGAMGNQIMPGCVKIGKMIPICAETAHLLPEWCVEDLVVESIWELCQEEAYTRRDDEKNEKLRQLIAPDVRFLLEDKAAKDREKRGTTDDVRNQKADPKQQMRYFVETLAAGTRFFWDITLDDAGELEFEAFCVALAEFGRMPFIGGKSSVGHGKVSVKFDKWLEIEPRLSPAGQAVAAPLGSLYRAHLETHSDEIRSLLDGLA